MKLKRTLLFFCLALVGFILPAQRLPHHSLAMGLQNSFATVSTYEINTSTLGLHFSHQRNFLSFFSLRTSFGLSYFLPAEATLGRPYQPEAFAAVTKRTYRYQQVQLALNLMPCFYYRDEHFNLFAGLAGGAGAYIVMRDRTDEIINYPVQGALFEDHVYQSDTYFQVGFKPSAGIGFYLTGDRAGGETGFEISYEKWLNPDGFTYRSGFTAWGLQLFYRYNFIH